MNKKQVNKIRQISKQYKNIVVSEVVWDNLSAPEKQELTMLCGFLGGDPTAIVSVNRPGGITYVLPSGEAFHMTEYLEHKRSKEAAEEQMINSSRFTEQGEYLGDIEEE